MTYRGHVKNGVVFLDGAVTLPDGTEVTVQPVLPNSTRDEGGADDSRGFWTARSVDELAAGQRVVPHTEIADLAGDWPDEESIDDFLADMRRERA